MVAHTLNCITWEADLLDFVVILVYIINSRTDMDI